MKWIITGAAGFIGTNAVTQVVARGDTVVGLDSLSRPGAADNLVHLQQVCGDTFQFVQGDVRDASALAGLMAQNDDVAVVLHLAGQVAVTTSIADPRADFEANALGAFNICEAVRLEAPEALLLYASTNKVYGSELGQLELRDGRWLSADHPDGIPETQPIDLHSPYACSKGLGDLYVLDYARIYGLKATSVRQSCIYGPRQFGIEDQGWIAWLTLAALNGRAFTIFGDGRQVRDVLHVDDLVRFYVACADNAPAVAGKAFNVGGGPGNVLSLLDLVAELERRLRHPLTYTFGAARPGDQRYYVSDIRRAHTLLEWSPEVTVAEGLDNLIGWLSDHGDAVLTALATPRPRDVDTRTASGA